MEPDKTASLNPLSGKKAEPPPRTMLGQTWVNIRQKIVAGLLLVLPFLVTFWILSWLYRFLENYVIDPSARLVIYFVKDRADVTELPPWFTDYVAPVLGVVGVGLLLYFLGMFARLRLAGVIDYVLLRLPVVKVIHNSVIRVFQALQGEGDYSRFKRVVLVGFPHPGMRVPAFVTASCKDEKTKKTILCVYVPTTPIPSSGYFLLVPEEDATELEWDVEETIQAIVSFGITAPDHVRYYNGVQEAPKEALEGKSKEEGDDARQSS